MTFLLDVSLLIALLDENHVHHETAFSWFEDQGDNRWATCPITENGLLRILTAPSYPVPLGPAAWVFEIFREFCAREDHDFWPDDFSLLEDASTRSLPSATSRTFIFLDSLREEEGNSPRWIGGCRLTWLMVA